MERHNDESDDTVYDGDANESICDDKSNDGFYGNGIQSVTSLEVDWSKPLVFDGYLDDVCVVDTMIIDVNQDSDVIDHPIFDVCEEVDVKGTLNFDMCSDDENLGVLSNAIFNCNILEVITQGIIKYFDSSFNKDGSKDMHHFEVPSGAILSYGCYDPFIQDLIMQHWIKKYWADWMDMVHGICKYTIQGPS